MIRREWRGMCGGRNLFDKSRTSARFGKATHVSMLSIISVGRSFTLGDFGIVDERSVSVVDGRRGVGREANGMGMFCNRENERVLCGSGGVGVDNWDSRVAVGGDDAGVDRGDVLR